VELEAQLCTEREKGAACCDAGLLVSWSCCGGGAPVPRQSERRETSGCCSAYRGGCSRPSLAKVLGGSWWRDGLMLDLGVVAAMLVDERPDHGASAPAMDCYGWVNSH